MLTRFCLFRCGSSTQIVRIPSVFLEPSLVLRIPSHKFHLYLSAVFIPHMPDHSKVRICITLISGCAVSDHIRNRYIFSQHDLLFLSFIILLMTVSTQISADPLLQKQSCQLVPLPFFQIIKTVVANGNTWQVSPAQLIPNFL